MHAVITDFNSFEVLIHHVKVNTGVQVSTLHPRLRATSNKSSKFHCCSTTAVTITTLAIVSGESQVNNYDALSLSRTPLSRIVTCTKKDRACLEQMLSMPLIRPPTVLFPAMHEQDDEIHSSLQSRLRIPSVDEETHEETAWLQNLFKLRRYKFWKALPQILRDCNSSTALLAFATPETDLFN